MTKLFLTKLIYFFIFKEDFGTPEDLVKYIDYLAGNDTAYLEYHAWRTESLPEDKAFDNGLNMSHTMKMLCNMCQVLDC